MNKMSTIIGISGSLRRASFNTALLRAAAGLMPAGSELRIESIEGIPLYNGDVEAAEGVVVVQVPRAARHRRCTVGECVARRWIATDVLRR